VTYISESITIYLHRETSFMYIDTTSSVLVQMVLVKYFLWQHLKIESVV